MFDPALGRGGEAEAAKDGSERSGVPDFQVAGEGQRGRGVWTRGVGVPATRAHAAGGAGPADPDS